jgi:hypothetical protein
VLEFASPELKKAVLIGPGFIGLICNTVTMFVTQFALSSMGKVATPDADKLTDAEIKRIKNPVLLLAWILVWLLPPWVFPATGVNGITFGCPTWFIYQMLLHAFITVLLMYVIWSWKPAPPNKRKSMVGGESEGLKTTGIEMTIM